MDINGDGHFTKHQNYVCHMYLHEQECEIACIQESFFEESKTWLLG